MSYKRNTLKLYSDTDPANMFQMSNSSGVVTFAIDASEELTVSGKTLFEGGDTFINREDGGVITEVSAETLFDNLDTNVAANAANNTSESARAISAEQALDLAWGAASTAIAADDASNHAIALGAIASEATRAGIAEGAIAANLATEVTRAVAAETGFTDDLNALTAVEVAHIATLNTALTNEVARASAAEANLQSDEDANQAAASAALASSDAALAAGVLSNSNALAAQSASAQAAEATMAGHIANILSNSDGASLDSLQEVVEFFNGADETHTNLLGLLMNKVLQLNEVINTFLDPDMPALDAVLQSYYDAYLCITVVNASGADGTSMASVLGDGIAHSGSSEAYAYFLQNIFTISYDLTQRVTINASGEKTANDWDYVTRDLSITLQTSAGVAGAAAAFDAAVISEGSVEAAFVSIHTVGSVASMQGLINAVYGFTPADLSKVPLVYADPQNYVLEVGQYGDRPYFKGSEVSYEPFVGWSLSYCSTAGDVSSKYSTILSGSMVGNTLTISTTPNTAGVEQAVEFPVSGNAISGSREGTFVSDVSVLSTV